MSKENIKPKGRLAEVTDTIAKAPETVEKRFSNPKERFSNFADAENSWLDCFSGVIFQVESKIYSLEAKEELGEKYVPAIDHLYKLRKRIEELKRDYPTRETVPPDEIKEELFQMLNVFA